MQKALLLLAVLNLFFAGLCVHDDDYLCVPSGSWMAHSGDQSEVFVSSLLYGCGVPPLFLSFVNFIVLAEVVRRMQNERGNKRREIFE